MPINLTRLALFSCGSNGGVAYGDLCPEAAHLHTLGTLLLLMHVVELNDQAFASMAAVGLCR